MADKELRIRLTCDTSDADRSSEAYTRRESQRTTRLLTDQEVAERAKQRLIQMTNRQRVDAAVEAAGAEKTHQDAVKKTTDSLSTLIKTQVGLAAFKNMASTIGGEWRKVADDIGRASREWQQFRQSLQGVASLENKSNTNAFAESEVDRAERARVTPAEAKDFREAFLSKASLYVGNGPAAKMSGEDADSFQEALMEYAKDKGVGQQEMAEFAGGLLAQQKGPISAKDMLARVGRTFGTLEASSAPVSHLIPATTRVMAQGYSAEEASRTLAALPEVAPEEEGTHLLRVAAEIRKANVEGRSEQYGIKDGMRPQQQLETLVGNLKDRSGGNAKELDRLLREFTHEDIAANTLRGMVNQVNFDQWKKVQGSIPDNQIQKTLESERVTEPGLQRAVDSSFAVEHARLGLRNDTVERRRKIAETELTRGGSFEHLQLGQLAGSMLPWADDMQTRQVNLQAIRRARSELGESSGLGDALASTNRGATDDLLRTLIKRIEEQNEMMRNEGKGRSNQATSPPMGRPQTPRTRP